jgi:polyisoprenoid-binding protein YceI
MFIAARPVAIVCLAAACGLVIAPNAFADTETYSIDSAHSFANWEVRHIVARTSGTFHDIRGNITLDTGNLSFSSVNAVISVYSLNSSHLRRDVHTLAEDFLDARNHPEITFVSTVVQPSSAERGTMKGQLTLHGVTRPISLDYQILGIGPDPWGGIRAGFKAVTRIKRSDYGITKFTPNGPVGNEVDITLLIEGIRLGADGQPFNAKAEAAERNRVIVNPMPSPPALETMPLTAPPATEPAQKESAAAPLR